MRNSGANMIPKYRNILLTASLSGQILLACEAAWREPLLLPVALPLIASRQYALAVLLHEAQHRLFAASRRLNDLFGEAIALTVGSDFAKSRMNHLSHHRYFGQEGKDPDYGIYCPFEGFQRPLSATRYTFLVQIILWMIMTLLWSWWVYPLFYALPLYCASLLDQFRIEQEHKGKRMRTFEVGVTERLFIAPLNMNYHAEHHAKPGVPWRELPQLRKEMGLQPEEYFS